jgi:hypothetical protein
LTEASVAEDVERIVVEELSAGIVDATSEHSNRDRLADANIAICTAWNHFLADTET